MNASGEETDAGLRCHVDRVFLVGNMALAASFRGTTGPDEIYGNGNNGNERA